MPSRIKVVIVVLLGTVLVGMVIIWVNQARLASQMAQCGNNLKALGLNLHSYHDVHRKLPQGWVVNDGLPLDKKLGIFFRLFPFVGSRMDLAGHFPDERKAWDAGENRYLAEDLDPIPGCPAIPNRHNNFTLATYVGLAGVGKDAAYLPAGAPRIGVFGYDRQLTFADIKDGTENTVAFAETATENGPWLSAGRATLRSLEGNVYLGQEASFSTNHRSSWWVGTPVLHMGFVDGSVRSFSYSLSPEVFEALVTVAASEKIPAWE